MENLIKTMADDGINESIELVTRLGREKKKAAALLSRQEGMFLVDQYYSLQKERLASAGRVRSMPNEPNDIMKWLTTNMFNLENDLKSALGYWAKQFTVGQWLQQVCGIGPVISAGLLAHLDIRKGKTAGHFWSFCGIAGHQVWEKGEKRPWNADLKSLLVFKAGECFVKVQNNDKDFYGKLFAERKKNEIEANEQFKFKDQAEEKLQKYKIGKTTDAYKFYSIGLLPPAHIHARARRWAVKVFLSHLHEVMFYDYYGDNTNYVPYVFSEHCHQPHKHRIRVPNWPLAESGKSLKELFGEEKKEITRHET